MKLKDADWKCSNKAVTVRGGRFDPYYGYETLILTEENIKALKEGKTLHTAVNEEYALLIKMEE